MWVVIWLVYLYLMCFRLSKFLLWILFLLETLTGKMSKFMTYLALILFAGHVNPSQWTVLPHFEHLLWLFEGGSLFEVGRKWLPFIFWPWCGSFLCGSLLLPCLGFARDFFFLYLCWGSSVLSDIVNLSGLLGVLQMLALYVSQWLLSSLTF